MRRRGHRRWRTPFALAVPATLTALLQGGSATAQTIQGLLVEEGSGRPIAGAFIVLVDSTDAPIATSLSSSSGGFLVRPPAPGTYRLRADRIGYSSAWSEPIRADAGEIVGHRLDVPVRPVRLDEMEVETRSRCEMLPDESLEIHRVWEEARKALAATVWTGQQQYYRFDAVLFERTLDRGGDAVGEVLYEEVRYYGRHPFRSIPATDLVLGGFVRYSAGFTNYYGPDADVLMSHDFLRRHCFNLEVGAEGQSSGLIGLTFEPLSDARLPDISGTLWIHSASAELRFLEYRYRNLNLRVSTRNLGGRVEFARLPSGAWIVQHWAIRTPLIASRERPRRVVLEGIDEGGGQVTAVYVTGRLLGAVSADSLPVRPPPDSLVVRFPIRE